MNNEDFVVVRQNDTVERLPPSYLLAKRVKELENRVQDLMTDKKWLHNRLDELSTQNEELPREVQVLRARIAELERDAHQRRRVMKRYLPVLQRLGASPLVWETFTKGTGIATLNGYLTAIAGKQPQEGE